MQSGILPDCQKGEKRVREVIRKNADKKYKVAFVDFLNGIVMKRYATKKFDGRKVEDGKIGELKEIIRFSASSFGLQPWKIKVVADQATKDRLQAASWNQQQITTCSHLFVICADTDLEGNIERYEKLMAETGTDAAKAKGYADYMRTFALGMDAGQRKTWAQKQCYIALSNALNGAKALGLDSCPMEGFDPKQYSEILGLPENLVPTVLCPVGYPADEPKPKLRFASEEVFF